MSDNRPEEGQRTGEKEKDLVISTNNSSIVSKRSVERIYCQDEEQFLRHFVGKYQRRSPTINRGYWLRMRAIDSIVTKFLKANVRNEKTSMIVNLGCGYDTLPFKYIDPVDDDDAGNDNVDDNGNSNCNGNDSKNANSTATNDDDDDDDDFYDDILFVDVDFPELIEKKVAILQQHEIFLTRLGDFEINNPRARGQALLDSPCYDALPCDLANLIELQTYLDTYDPVTVSILFVAEVSMTYMNTNVANALISLASQYGDAHFCLLEQHLPDGPSNCFADTMLRHFNKLNSPLQSVLKYPTLDDQQRRFQELGWPKVKIRNLWNIWSDDDFVGPTERARLDRLEPFDEWEELALFASHYFLLVASSSCSFALNLWHDSVGSIPLIYPEKFYPPNFWPLEIQSHQLPKQFGPRRYAVSFAWGPVFDASNHGGPVSRRQLYVHGGHGPKKKLDDSFRLCDKSYQPKDMPLECTRIPQEELMCHTAVTLDDRRVCMLGGRTSPSHASKKIWWKIKDDWYSLESPEHLNGVYRHAAVGVCTSPLASRAPNAVLVFGGKRDQSNLTSDFTLLSCTLTSRFESQILILGRDKYRLPPKRFGACMFTDPCGDGTWGWLTGGISESGTILLDIWKWKLLIDDKSTAPMHCTGIECTDMTWKFALHGIMRDDVYRFGAKAVAIGRNILLMGGVSANGTVPLDHTILCIDLSNLLVAKIPLTVKGPRPFLIGFTADSFSSDTIVITGGGANCFSFGPYWNEGFCVLSTKEGQGLHDWQLDAPLPTRVVLPPKETALRDDSSPGAKPSLEIIRRQTINESDEFENIVAAGLPVIIESLDLGSCKTWTLDSLRLKIGINTPVTTHTAQTENMNFLDRNFSYTRETCDAFFRSIERGEPKYLRAISTTDPSKKATDLAEDFPGLAEDFVLPPQLELVRRNAHSSPLRISGSVSMWLHYDVMANVLCQIHGTKRLLLYHPRNVDQLKFPPGASSSPLSPLNDSNERPNVKAYEAQLRPGDVLYIPPLWPHTATPTDGASVAVNVFFKSFASTHYAAGRDVYGNRDLQAYEHGRRDVERITNSVKDLPGDARSFYLKRLAQELLEVADR